MARVPIGNLVSFGNFTIADINAHAIYSKQTNHDRRWIGAFVQIAGQQFPYDRYGISAAPYAQYQVSWIITIVAPYLISNVKATPETAYKYLEDQLKVLDDALEVQGTDGTSGQVQMLAVLSADGSSVYSALARIQEMQFQLVAGTDNLSFDVTLSFMLVSQWVAGLG